MLIGYKEDHVSRTCALVKCSFWVASKQESCVTVSCRDDYWRAKTAITTAVKKELERDRLNSKTVLKSSRGNLGSSSGMQ